MTRWTRTVAMAQLLAALALAPSAIGQTAPTRMALPSPALAAPALPTMAAPTLPALPGMSSALPGMSDLPGMSSALPDMNLSLPVDPAGASALAPPAGGRISPLAANPFSMNLPGQVTIMLPDGNPRARMATALKILLAMTILALAPSILVMMTSFTRIVVVLSFVRRALALQEVPPTQVVIGLALFLTFFTMAPTGDRVYRESLQPYLAGQLTDAEAFAAAQLPVREFMFRNTRKAEMSLFIDISRIHPPRTRADVPTWVLVPAFLLSEIKTAFMIGFLIFIPFLVIDMVVASVLLSMGMMMLPPVIVSLPFKIILFVLVDGWSLVVLSLARSYL